MNQAPLLSQPVDCPERDRREVSGVRYSVCRLPIADTCPYAHCPLQKMPQFHEPRDKWERQPGQRRAEEMKQCQEA